MKISVIAKSMFEFAKQMENEFPTCEFSYGENDIENADIIWGNYAPANLKNCKNIKWMQVVTAGINVYTPEVCPENFLLTNSVGAYTLSISEYILAAQLAMYRNLHHFRDLQKQHIWKNAGAVRSVKGSTVLIYGLGSIGLAYAKLAKAMGATVLAVRRTNTNPVDGVDEMYLTDNFKDVLKRADTVVITAPGTEETRNVFNAETFEMFKTGAVLINIGRGTIVNTDDLVSALENGKLSGAVLDVVDPEPLPKEHVLWDMENVILTNHTSGGYGIEETEQVKREVFYQNLKNFLENKPMINLANPEKGY